MASISIQDFPRQTFGTICLQWGIPFLVVVIVWAIILQKFFKWRPILLRKYAIANFLETEVTDFKVSIVEYIWWFVYALPFLLCIGWGINTFLSIDYPVLGIDLIIAPPALLILLLGFLNFENNGFKISKSVKITIGCAGILLIALTFVDAFMISEKSWMAGGYLIIWPILVFYGFYQCYTRENFKLNEMMEMTKSEDSIKTFINDISQKNYENWIEGGKYSTGLMKYLGMGISLAVSAACSLLFYFYWDKTATQKSATIATSVGSFIVDASIILTITFSISNLNNIILLLIGFAIKAVAISFSSRFWMAGHGLIFFFVGTFYLTRILIWIFNKFTKIDNEFEGMENIDEDVRNTIDNMNTDVNHVSTTELIISSLIFIVYLVALICELDALDLSDMEEIGITANYTISQRHMLIGFIILTIATSFTISLWQIDSNNFEIADLSSIPPLIEIVCDVIVWIGFMFAVDFRSGDLGVYGASLYSILSGYLVSRRILNVHIRNDTFRGLIFGHYIYGLLILSILASMICLIVLPFLGETKFGGCYVLSLLMSLLSFYSYFIESREENSEENKSYEWFWRMASIISWISFLIFSCLEYKTVLIGLSVFILILWVCSIIWQAVLVTRKGLVIEKINLYFIAIPAGIITVLAVILFIFYPLSSCILFFFSVLVFLSTVYFFVKQNSDIVYKYSKIIVLAVLVVLEILDLFCFIYVAKSTFISLTSICMTLFITSFCYLLISTMSSEKAGRIIFTNIYFPVRKLKGGEVKNLPFFGLFFSISFAAAWIWGVFSSVFFIYPWFGILAQVAAYSLFTFIVFVNLTDFDCGAIQALEVLDEKNINYCIGKTIKTVSVNFGSEMEEMEISDYESFMNYVDRRTEISNSKSLFASILRGQLYITGEVNFNVIIDSIKNYLAKNGTSWKYLDLEKKYSLKERVSLFNIYKAIENFEKPNKQKVTKCENFVEKQDEKRQIVQDEVLKNLSNEYGQILKSLFNNKYEDKNFYPLAKYREDDKEIFKNCKWQRCENFLTGPFLSDTKPSDIIQGNLGDCYLISSLTAVSQNFNVIDDLFEKPIFAEKGVFSVKFRIFDKTVPIVVDSKLPFRNNKIFSSYPNDKSRSPWWFTIIEKSWAKLNGSYTAIDGGQCHRALFLFDFGQPFQFIFEDDKVKEEIVNGNLWKKMIKIKETGGYLCCGSNSGSDTDKNEHGVILGHAYTILDVVEIQNFKLIKLRNPWGEGEWNGDWSDTSNLWDLHKDITRELKQENKDDGEFWMNFKDFLLNFRTLYVLDKMKDKFYIKLSSSFCKNKYDGANPYSKESPDLTHVQNYLLRVRSPTILHCLLERTGANTKIRAVMCYNGGKFIDRMWSGIKNRSDFCPGNWPMESFDWSIEDTQKPWTLALTRDADENESKFIFHIWSDCLIELEPMQMEEEMPPHEISTSMNF